ncbi:MAG: 2-hydroxyacyl-CoA dehydratase [Planctomycetota bacterium]
MSAGLAPLLARAEELAFDTGLASVRAWKERTGGLAIGFLPVYVPRELLHAMGCLPVGILGSGDIEIIRGDAFYQSYICHLPRSVIELGLGGRLDPLDGVLFPAICDVIRNLSGIWKLQFPDKLSRYLDVPQDFDGAIGGTFYRHELEELVRDLEARGARRSTRQRCGPRSGLQPPPRGRAGALRPAPRAAVEGPDGRALHGLRAGLVVPVEEHLEMLAAYPGRVLADEERRPMDQARVMLVGSFCEQPPIGLLKTLERAGCYIVDDDLCQVHRWIRAIPTDGDPLDRLVDAFLHDAIPHAVRYDEKADKARDLVDRVHACGAEGLLFCARRSATRRSSTSRWPSRPSSGPASRGRASSTPRTPASSTSSGSRPGPSPTRSSCGAEPPEQR